MDLSRRWNRGLPGPWDVLALLVLFLAGLLMGWGDALSASHPPEGPVAVPVWAASPADP